MEGIVRDTKILPYARKIKRVRNPGNNLISHLRCQLPLLGEALLLLATLPLRFHPRENFEYCTKCKRCTNVSLPLARGGGPLAVEGIVRDTKILSFPEVNALEGSVPTPPNPRGMKRISLPVNPLRLASGNPAPLTKGRLNEVHDSSFPLESEKTLDQ